MVSVSWQNASVSVGLTRGRRARTTSHFSKCLDVIKEHQHALVIALGIRSNVTMHHVTSMNK